MLAERKLDEDCARDRVVSSILFVRIVQWASDGGPAAGSPLEPCGVVLSCPFQAIG
jgi:hypothetical protein